MSTKLFGTDGIRGVAGKYPLDDATIRSIGAAAANILKRAGSRSIVIIGRDTRESGTAIAASLKKEFSRAGLTVWDVGVIPTPGVAFLTRAYPVLAGVVISASHNPYQDNGIKFFSHSGTKLPDALESEIENEIRRIQEQGPGKCAVKAGPVLSRTSLSREYRAFLAGTLPPGIRLDGMKLAIDCANGATSGVAAKVLADLGAEVFVTNAAPNGKNINKNCGALHPEGLAKEVVRRKAACGLAFDGDGDRIIFADEKGAIRDGDFLLTIAAWYWKQNGRLKNDTLITTIMANLGLSRAMESYGIRVTQTPVGDRYVHEEMIRRGAVIGGEQSGHIIFSDFLSTGDGILSALQILAILVQTGKSLSSLCGLMKKYPQVLLNTLVDSKIPLDLLPATSQIIRDAQEKMKHDGRILVRYSGTENLLRVMVEGQSKSLISSLAREISKMAKKEIERIRV